MSSHLPPDCCSFSLRPCGIPWTFLLFGRVKTKVHSQLLVSGLRGDLLHPWATTHRGNSESVNHASLTRLSSRHTAPQGLFPDLSVWSSQVSPPEGRGREELVHLVLMIKTQPTFMAIPSFTVCVSFRAFTEQVGIPGPWVRLSSWWLCRFNSEAWV